MPGAVGEPQLRSVRHFELLASAALLVAAMKLAGLWPPIAYAFAGIGALHAASLAASLRRLPGRGRALQFVVAASILSSSMAMLGLHAAAAARNVAGALLTIAACAFLGAVGYGLLLRKVLDYRLALAPLAGTAIACGLAVYAVYTLTRGHPASGSYWLALSWWLTFSAGLYVTGRRPARA